MVVAVRRMLNAPAVRSREDAPVADVAARRTPVRRRPKDASKAVEVVDAAMADISAASGERNVRQASGLEPPTRVLARELSALSRHAMIQLSFAVGLPVLAGALILPQLWLFSRIVQMGVVEGAKVETLVPQALEIAALIGLRACLVSRGEASGAAAASEIALGLRKTLFDQFLQMRPDWTAARPSGELSGAIVDQVDALEPYFANYLPAMALAATLPILFALTAIVVDPVVGVIFLVSAPLIPVFMALVGWGAEAASAQHQQAFLRLTGFFADRLRGLVTLKLLGRAEAETRRLRQTGDELRLRTLGVLRIAFLSSAVLEFFAALSVAGVALYVGLGYLGFVHVHAVPMTLQTGVFCLMLAPEVYFPLRLLASHHHDRAAAKAATLALGEMFGAPLIIAAATAAGSKPSLPASRAAISVAVSNVFVTAPGAARAILSDIDFVAAAGARVALVGASGSGKSTFLETLAGLRAFEGTIELGGARLTDMSNSALRSGVALLGQRPRLFQGTIADNIKFGRADASDDEVDRAAELSGVMRFADALPDGLRTPVGEGGLGLSGGEIHRVALARIFLRDPALILLDEPTAHLDRATEQAVLDGILTFAKGRTLVVATHASAVVERMSLVLRVEGRRISSLDPVTPP